MTTRRELLLSAAAAASLPAGLRGAEDGFEPLFNGRDLAGWQGDTLLWFVDNGELVGRSPGIGYNDFLTSVERYGDFVLRFDVRLVDDIGNSGVQFRSERVRGSMEMIGYQADIGPGWWGNLYDESRRRTNLAEADPKLIERTLKKNDWNAYEIYAQGPKIRLSLNGKVTAEYEEKEPGMAADGLLGLQVHSGPPLEVRFRNIRLKGL